MRNNFRKGGGNKKANKAKQIQINFFLINQQLIGIQIPYGNCTQEVKYILKEGEGFWSYDEKCWIIKRAGYDNVLKRIQEYFFRLNNEQSQQKSFKVNQIQQFVYRAQKILTTPLQQIKYTSTSPYYNTTLKYNSVQTKIQPQSLPFYSRLFPFQQQSLTFGIRHHGRLLLADEMGVGKTIQSLAIAYIYRHEWPLLIICPPTLKFNWQNEIRRWYADVQPAEVQLVNSAKVAFRVGVKVIIVSYDLAWRMKDVFQEIKVVIADQAHYLKNPQAKRSQILVPFLSSRKRVILLTGTPAFARPKEIFNLITIVRPGLFKTFKPFGNRYCDPKWNHWSHSYQYNGCKNVKQLHYILRDNIMIRRLKSQVLKDLPDKSRQKIVLQTQASVVKKISEVLKKNNVSKMQTFFAEYINKSTADEDETTDKREEIMQAYRLSGMAKIKAVKQYINDILQNDIKILVFAHHMNVMNQIQADLKDKKHKFIRIDGNVSQQERASNVERFQTDPTILVALLSITAAGVGITMTAASTVIFAQLHWTPALMIQAEDRAHRVGQKDSVNCHYLIGQNTLDQMLYKFLEKKVLNVSSFVDGEKKNLDFEELEKGAKGKFSKKQVTKVMTVDVKKSTGNSQMLSVPWSLDEREDGSPKSVYTDISSSSLEPTQGAGSRKRTPTQSDDVGRLMKRLPVNTLDSFLLKREQIPEGSELKYNSWSEQKQGNKEKDSQTKQGSKKNQKRDKSQLIDSDDQFQKIIQEYYSKKNQDNQRSNQQENPIRTNNIQTEPQRTQSNKGSYISPTSTVSMENSNFNQKEFEI